MFKKQKMKSKSGITLVALVVTIVVLLLLNGYYYVGGTENTGLVISDKSSDENKYKQLKMEKFQRMIWMVTNGFGCQ